MVCATSGGPSGSWTSPNCPRKSAFRRSYTLYDPPELVDLVSPDLGRYVDDVIDEHDAIYTDNDLPDPVNRMCLADSRLFLPGLNLAYTDRASMAASIEVRVPFVDPIVVAAAFSIPGSDKIRGRTSKAALKDAAAAWLPQEIIHRPKASFSAPLRAWISHDLKDIVDRELLDGELVASWLPPPRAARAARARGAERPPGPLQADLAAADHRDVVPAGPSRRRDGVTATTAADHPNPNDPNRNDQNRGAR